MKSITRAKHVIATKWNAKRVSRGSKTLRGVQGQSPCRSPEAEPLVRCRADSPAVRKDYAMQTLSEAIGYRFHNPALLRQALTHPSMGQNDNQRLEFLGDAVLQYIMSDLLYAKYPNEREGKLTHLRALLVCEAALSQVARSLHVGEALIMDKGEEMTGGRDKPSVLCDAMEALLAAVYLDGGMEAAREIVVRCWPQPDEVQRPMQDSKGALQEYLQQDGGDAPTYEIVSQSGPPHSRTFEASVSRYGQELARGTGRSKKQAEQAAALAALEQLTKK